MDIILSKSERMERIEKKMKELEFRMNKNFSRMDDSFESFRNIVLHLQKENAELKKDRDFLLAKYKEVVRNVIPEPIKKSVQENASLIREIALDGLTGEKKGNDIDDLFELVMNKKKISLSSASKKLGVEENKMRYWALKLQKQKLIDVKGSGNQLELFKKT